MRTLIAGFALVCAGLLFTCNTNQAQDKKSEKKETVLTGKITCNKCDLGKSTKCETVIVVKDAKSKKDVVYFFDKDSHGKFHDDICSAGKNGTVTGFITDQKKNIINVKKVAYD